MKRDALQDYFDIVEIWNAEGCWNMDLSLFWVNWRYK